MSDKPGTCLYPGPESLVRVSVEDAIVLTSDQIIFGNSFVKASADDPELYVRVPPREVRPA